MVINRLLIFNIIVVIITVFAVFYDKRNKKHGKSVFRKVKDQVFHSSFSRDCTLIYHHFTQDGTIFIF